LNFARFVTASSVNLFLKFFFVFLCLGLVFFPPRGLFCRPLSQCLPPSNLLSLLEYPLLHHSVSFSPRTPPLFLFPAPLPLFFPSERRFFQGLVIQGTTVLRLPVPRFPPFSPFQIVKLTFLLLLAFPFNHFPPSWLSPFRDNSTSYPSNPVLGPLCGILGVVYSFSPPRSNHLVSHDILQYGLPSLFVNHDRVFSRLSPALADPHTQEIEPVQRLSQLFFSPAVFKGIRTEIPYPFPRKSPIRCGFF